MPVDSDPQNGFRKIARLYKVLSACMTTVMRAHDERELLQDVCRVLVVGGGYPFAHACGPGPGGGCAQLAQAGNLSDETDLPVFSDSPESRAFRGHRRVVIHDIHHSRHSSEWRRAALEKGFRAAIAIPLQRDGELVGVLGIYASEPGSFEPEECSLLQEIAGNLAIGIQAIRLRRERDQVQHALEGREADLRRVIEHEADGTVVIDVDGTVLFANDAAETMLGRPAERLTGSQFGYPLIHGEWTEIVILRPNHTIAVVEMRSVETEWGGRLASIVSMHDVTERKQFEDERSAHVEQLKRAMLQTIEAVAATLEIRDPYTAGHHRQVARLAAAIGEELGLSNDEIVGLRLGASIHDIGKIYVPSEILNRPGQLGQLEQQMVRTHPEVGYEILKDAEFPWPIAKMIRQHHERLDGSGYPEALKNGAICREARILAVADVVDAISTHRPYRPALGIDTALSEIESHRGTLYDPEVVDACVRLFAQKGFKLEVTEPGHGVAN